jgi:integrase
VTVSPVADVTRPAVDRNTSTTPGMTIGQAGALLAAADNDTYRRAPRTAAIVAVLLCTGIRVGELLDADITDLRWDRGHRTLLVTRKDGKKQPIVLPPTTTARVDAYLAGREDLARIWLPVPVGGAGATTPRPLIATAGGRRLDPGTVWRLLRRLAASTPELAPLQRRLSAHVLRHSHATLYQVGGVASDATFPAGCDAVAVGV